LDTITPKNIVHIPDDQKLFAPNEKLPVDIVFAPTISYGDDVSSECVKQLSKARLFAYLTFSATTRASLLDHLSRVRATTHQYPENVYDKGYNSNYRQ
jgi:hypothetical protein